MDPVLIYLAMGVALIVAWGLPRRPKPPELPRKPLVAEKAPGPLVDLADRFGLRVTGSSAVGQVREVRIAIRALSRDGAPAGYALGAELLEPLGFELELRPGTTQRSASEPVFGSPGFEAALAVESSDRDRARATLGGLAGDELLRAALEGWNPTLVRERLSFELPPRSHPRDLRRAVETLVTLARALRAGAKQQASRPDEPELPGRDPTEQRALVAWQKLVDRWGAELGRDPVVLEVERPAGSLRVRLVRLKQGGWRTRFELAPPRPFSTSMELVKADRVPAGDSRRRNDIEVGARELDEGFVITGDEAEVQKLLTPGAQASLVALGAQVSRLALRRNALSAAVDDALLDVERLAELCEAVEAVAAELLPDSSAGAYR